MTSTITEIKKRSDTSPNNINILDEFTKIEIKL